MGWFSSSPSKVSGVTNYEEPKYLEDLPPKFEDVDPPQEISKAAALAKEFKFSDLTIERFVKMPCFREAMITGFQAMGVLGGVTFLIRKNFQRSLNWGMTGFFLGNIIGFEQCRSIRRKSFETVEKAKQKKNDNNESKWKDIGDDDGLEKFEEFNKKSK